MPIKKTPLKKRCRKRGRPAKNSKGGRPKKFVKPVELHIVLERHVVNYFDSVIERLKANGTNITRGDIISLCISKFIK